jgi:hypothetical protein
MTLEREIADVFSAVHGVEAVYASWEGDCLHALIVITDDEDERVLDAASQAKLHIYDNHPESLLNLHIIARRGRPLRHVVGHRTPLCRQNLAPGFAKSH